MYRRQAVMHSLRWTGALIWRLLVRVHWWTRHAGTVPKYSTVQYSTVPVRTVFLDIWIYGSIPKGTGKEAFCSLNPTPSLFTTVVAVRHRGALGTVRHQVPRVLYNGTLGTVRSCQLVAIRQPLYASPLRAALAANLGSESPHCFLRRAPLVQYLALCAASLPLSPLPILYHYGAVRVPCPFRLPDFALAHPCNRPGRSRPPAAYGTVQRYSTRSKRRLLLPEA